MYDDATTFEGLTKEGIPHGKGVMWMGSLRGGAGFQHPVQGDRCGVGYIVQDLELAGVGIGSAHRTRQRRVT